MYIRVFFISRFTSWMDISNISMVNASKLLVFVQVSGAPLGADGSIMSCAATC